MKKVYYMILLFIICLFTLSGCSRDELKKEIDELKNNNKVQEDKISELDRLLVEQENDYDKKLSLVQDQLNSIQSDIKKPDYFSFLYSDITMEGSIHAAYKENNLLFYELDLPFFSDSYTTYSIVVLFGKEDQNGFEYNRLAVPNLEYPAVNDLPSDKIRCKFGLEINEDDKIIMLVAYERNKGLLWRYEVFLTPIEDI